MKAAVYLISVVLFIIGALPSRAVADDADLDKKPAIVDNPVRKLEPNKMLTSGGIQGAPAEDVVVEPEFGLSHITRQRELGMGYEDITHKLHAQAGGRLKFSDLFYLGFATKLPVYQYEATEGKTPGGAATPTSAGRHEYDILRLSPNNLTWTGEMGVRVGQLLDLNLYYDQNTLTSPAQPGILTDEKVIGTRFIFKFK